MLNANLFHGKLGPLYLVQFPGTQRTTHCFSLQRAGIVNFTFLGLCISRVSWAASVCLAFPQKSHFWDHSCGCLLCTLSSVCVFYPVTIKCKMWPCKKLLLAPVDAPSCGDLHASQDFSTAVWALLSSVDKKSVHELSLQQAAHVGKGNICESPLTVKKTDIERMLYRENTYGNVLRKNKRI